jgi:site-specific recombinase XerD
MINIDLNVFERHLQVMKGLQPSSCARYRVHVEEFFNYRIQAAQDGPVSEIRWEDIESYLDWCWSQGNCAQTRRTKISALQNFFRFLISAGIITDDPTADIRRPSSDNDPVLSFSRDEVLRLFGTLDVAIEKDLRDAVFLISGAFAGLRVGEIIKLNVEDISESDEGKHVFFTVRKTQKGRNRVVQIWEAPSIIVRRLLAARLGQGARKGDPLLVSYLKSGWPRERNRRITAKALDNLLKMLARTAGIRKPAINSHMLRISHLEALQACDYDIPQIVEQLGWKCLDSVARYLIRRQKPRREYESLAEYWQDFTKTWTTKGDVNAYGGNADRDGGSAD